MLQQLKPRHIKLLKLLADQSENQPASFFSEFFNVSTKTILSDFEILNQWLQPTSLNIVKLPRKGIWLEGQLDQLDQVYREYLELNETLSQKDYPVVRQLNIVKQALIESQTVSIHALESKFYVSTTSIRNDVETLSNLFNVFNVGILMNKDQITFMGQESDLQKALKHFIMDFVISNEFEAVFLEYEPLQQVMKQLFDEELMMLVKREVNQLVENNTKVISHWFISSLEITMLIQFVRILKNHHMKKEDVKFKTISHLEPYMLTVEMIESYKRNFGLVFLEEDIYYLSQQIYAHGIEPGVRNIKLLKHYEATVCLMVQRMSDHLRIDLSDDETLHQSLLSHLPPMIYRLKRNIDVKNPLLEEIKNQYIVLFSLTWYVAIDLESKYNVTLNDDEISFLFIYFQVSLEKRYRHQFKNIVVVCPYGLATSELVFTRVRQVIPYIDNITIMTTHELYVSDLTHVDYIISTVKLDEVVPPVIYVSPLMTEKDLETVMKFNSTITSRVNRLEMREDINGSFDDLIDPDFIFTNQSLKTKEAVLDKMIAVFLEHGYVNEGFAQGIYDREKMGDTSLYTGVALPHAFPTTVKISKIAILALQDDIQWGSNPVSIVILVAISERDTDRIKQILSKLLVILESRDFIERLRQITNQQELMKQLKQLL